MQTTQLEICANSAFSALQAQLGGAHRVELCAGIPEGGTTPSIGEIWKAKKLLQIPVFVIIRPRGGDFLYTDDEIEIMTFDIQEAVKIGADGFVFGCLNPDGSINVSQNAKLIAATQGKPCTFHRAFDVCANPDESLEQIIALGFDRILTSGLQKTAFEGKDEIARLISLAQDRIIIMPGCGINEENIHEIAVATNAVEFHLSARTSITSAMEYKNKNVNMGDEVDEYSRLITSSTRIKNTLKQL